MVIIQTRLELGVSFYTSLQDLSGSVIEITYLLQIVTDEHHKTEAAESHIQLTLFN